MSGLNLLPCPFCGSKAETETSDSGGEYVCCTGCGVRIYVGHCSYARDEDCERSWNTRANPLLPRVSPEDLVEGKWYVVKHRPEYNNGGVTVAECDMDNTVYDEVAEDWVECEPFPIMWTIGGDHHFVPQFFEAIWGPLPGFGLDDRAAQPTSQCGTEFAMTVGHSPE